MTSPAAGRRGGAGGTANGAARNTASAPASPAQDYQPRVIPPPVKSKIKGGYVCGWCIGHKHEKCYNGFERPKGVVGWCTCTICDHPPPAFADDVDDDEDEEEF